MANSRHNKYVSVTDWFAKPSDNTDSQTNVPSSGNSYAGGFVGGASTGSGPSYWELRLDEKGNAYIWTKYHIATLYGVTMYRNDGSLDLPSIYKGLPIDEETLYWEPILDSEGNFIREVLKARGGESSGGVADSVAWVNVYGKPTWLSDDKIDYSEITGTPDLTVYALKTLIPSLSGYATEQWVVNKGYATTASIPSALKNPYALTFGSKTYDGSATKSITASDLGAALSSDLAKYLPLSGGVLTANNSDTALILKGNTNGSWVSFRGNDDTFYGSIGVQNDKTPYFYDRTAAYKIWHAGNDGSGSGLDADLLDGVHLMGKGGNSGIMRAWSRHEGYTISKQYFGNGNVVVMDPKPTDDSNLWANTTIFSLGDMETRSHQLAFGYGKDVILYRRVYDGPTYNSWKTIAFTDSNVASATKLQTARTIWGQSFDGTGNVTGNINLPNSSKIFIKDASNNDICVTQIYGNDLHFGNGANSKGYDTYIGGNRIIMRYGTSSTWGFVLSETGNVGIGTTSPSAKLHVYGGANPIMCESTAEESSIYFVGNGSGSAYKWAVGKGVWGLSGKFGIGEYNTKKALYMQIGIDGNVGIGVPYTANPSAKLHVVGNILATGGVTMQSQRSLKNVIDERGLSLTELSAIKPTRYTWKDKRDDRLHFGGIADDIEKVLPEVIYKTADGTLTMDYGNTGFAIASSLIKPVIDHETKIRMLEIRVKELEEELKRYSA